MRAAGLEPKALAHITGGGFHENVPRVLPPRLAARVELGSWDVPELFRTLVGWGDLPDDEAFRVWNMGIGLVAVVGRADAAAAEELGLAVIGELVEVGDDAPRVELVGGWR